MKVTASSTIKKDFLSLPAQTKSFLIVVLGLCRVLKWLLLISLEMLSASQASSQALSRRSSHPTHTGS